ncbi:MAG: hypothetical protein OER96_05010 [Gammaproteobacteria bacterium]|nr:hypothetical protein [Gammaproteobacteria bacterium]
MYAKVYLLACASDKVDALMAHYDSVITPAIRASVYHVGHQMIQMDDDKWVLVSNYKSKEAAEAATSMVQELVNPMIDKFGMSLDLYTEGDVVRSI